jgi:hypothetical protein
MSRPWSSFPTPCIEVTANPVVCILYDGLRLICLEWWTVKAAKLPLQRMCQGIDGPFALPGLQGDAARQSFNVFGEPKGQPSVLASDMIADPTIGQMLSHGVTSASVIVCSHLLRATDRWVPLFLCHSHQHTMQ